MSLKVVKSFLGMWTASYFNPTKIGFYYNVATYIHTRDEVNALLAAYSTELNAMVADIVKYKDTMQDYHFEWKIRAAFLLGTKADIGAKRKSS